MKFSLKNIIALNLCLIIITVYYIHTGIALSTAVKIYFFCMLFSWILYFLEKKSRRLSIFTLTVGFDIVFAILFFKAYHANIPHSIVPFSPYILMAIAFNIYAFYYFKATWKGICSRFEKRKERSTRRK